ncbi:glutathione synthase [Geothermobacter ehrlichii]|uniref:Glutathione synthetase n=1 Tax=Geothermobacter ehrlichii TaxID=213224 RepID=A0A5D3WEZ6_9BACT|nr:glutathione synthase [Geothermobacter ehrlichii]TYO95851.1 glutathione synthase [Geothermobacter ehrlichii]
MRIAFLRGPLGHINPDTETSILLMYECHLRSHQVFFLEPHDLYIRNNRVVGRMREITAPADCDLHAFWRHAIACVEDEKKIFEELRELDVLFLRKNPPLLMEMMELLASVEDQVFLINSLRGQLLGSSKLYTLNFPDIIPETHVSRDPARLRRIIDDFGGTMVMKPLRGFGGQGVIKVSASDPENLNSLLDFYVRVNEPYHRREPIMVQEFIEAVRTDGDIRIMLLNGEVLGAFRRMPHGTDFRANLRAGGDYFPHELTPQQQHICDVIRERLIRDGLYFVGIDIIGDKLIEINCVSPGGIPRINQFTNQRLEKKVVDFLERMAAEKSGGSNPVAPRFPPETGLC